MVTDEETREIRKNDAVESVKERARKLGVEISEVVWKTDNFQEYFYVTWRDLIPERPNKKRHKKIHINENDLKDDGSWPKVEAQILGWFDREVAPLCPELDDDAET
jgi:hypothetical protein